MTTWSQTLLLWSWQALILVGVVLVIVKIARSQTAATRHSFWLLTVVAVALLPLANAVIRAWPSITPEAVAPIAYVAQLPAVTMTATSTDAQSAAVTRSLLLPLLFAIWITGVLVSLIHSLRVLRHWRRIACSALAVDRVSLPVPVGYSSEITTPVVAGTIRPMILLPADIETWTTSEERRAILLHELAHVERRDHWMNLVQSLLNAVFFFHPAVRYALRQLVFERELACDERVLATGANAASYAEIIFKVAERSIPAQRSDCPAFHSAGKILERRIDMILSRPHSTSHHWHLPLIVRAAIVLVLTALLLPQRVSSAEALTLTPPEIQLASIQPFAMVAAAMGEEPRPTPPAEPIQAAAQPVPQATQPPVEMGRIDGRIFDPAGLIVQNVTVTLVGATPGTTRSTATDSTGAYSFLLVPPGEYSLQTKFPGFANTAQTIVVRPGNYFTRDISIAIASTSTMVNVSVSRSGTPVNLSPASPPPPRPGGDYVQPHLDFAVRPVYPASARAAGIQDYVVLQGAISKDGTVVSLQRDSTQPGSGNPDLIQAAMNAVKQWRYKPGLLNGVPVETMTTITVNFTMD